MPNRCFFFWSIRRQRARVTGTYHGVCALVSLLLEVQVMLYMLVSSLGRSDRRECDHHVELAPSLLRDLERRCFERLFGAALEGFMELVGRFLEARSWDIVAVRVHEEYADVPCAHRETFDLGGLVAMEPRSVSTSLRVGDWEGLFCD